MKTNTKEMKTKMRTIKMNRKQILAGMMACMCFSAQAQETKVQTEIQEVKNVEMKKDDSPKQESKGKFIIQVFANLHTGFGEGKNDRGFELERSYLGYEYNLGKGFSVKGVMDIGKSNSVEDYHRIVYIKNAMVSWKTGKLTLNGGLISTTQFNFQEKFWGYRYVMKSFQDQYKFGSSADLGLSAAYKFADWVSADAIIVNGEGYKKIQVNDGFNYGLGFTFTPVKGLQVRLYGGLNEAAADGKANTWNMASFVGYKHEKFTIGAEYNHMWNASYKQDADQYGYSIFASTKLSKVVDLYARFDDVYSKDGWNAKKDQQAAILGAQVKLGKYVKIAPNLRMSKSKADDAKSQYSAYISCYFGL